MKATMVWIAIFWAAFVFLFYRGMYTRYVRHRDYAEFARAAFSAVQEHFTELKAKSVSLVVDKGFNIKDDSAWKEALEIFITNIVAPGLKPQVRVRIRSLPSVSKEFSTFVYHFVSDLVEHETMPESYDLRAHILAIEGDVDPIAFMSGTYKFLPGKEIRTRLALVLVAIGMFATQDHAYAVDGDPFTPLSACNALIDVEGFGPSSGGYKELGEGSYSCATSYKNLGNGDLPNNVAMYGRGTSDQVTRVKIMLNVNERGRAAKDIKTLADLCNKMVAELVGSSPKNLIKKVSQGKPFNDPFHGYRVFLTKSVWPTGKGFELNCGIATLDHKE